MRSNYAVRRPVENAYLVRERERRRLRELGLLALIVAPVVLGVLGNVWIQVEVLAAGYQIRELDQRLHDCRQNELDLRLEASYLASPAAIERRAAELEMAPATVDQTVFGERSR